MTKVHILVDALSRFEYYHLSFKCNIKRVCHRWQLQNVSFLL